tara:strand:- start:409 stop:2166 length:1758 start_codon:yes stop_codon:yes gene_type:complete
MEYAQPKYNGEPTIKAIASGLGTLGRYGDNYMVHAAEGETVVPAEVLDANPELKQHLFWQMKMMGIKDPNRYVVGNNLNSINPVTGQPEFFFKKIFKAVKKVFKKVLPIAAPIIGNLIAPGIGGIIASGLVTKLQGGSWGDVLKSAALSYGVGALGQGLGGALTSAQAGTGIGSGFLGGLQRGALAPFQAAGNLFSSGANNPLAQGIFGPGGTQTFFSGANVPDQTGFSLQQGAPPVGSQTLGYKGGIFPTYNPNAAAAGGASAVTGGTDVNRRVINRGPYTNQAGPGTRVNTGGTDVNVQRYAQLGGENPGIDPWQRPVGAPATSSEKVIFGANDPATQAQLRMSQSSVPEGYYDQLTQPSAAETIQTNTPAGEQPNVFRRIITGEGEGGRLGGAERLAERAWEDLGPTAVGFGVPAALAYFATDDPDDLPEDNKPLPGTEEANYYLEYQSRKGEDGRPLKDAEGIRLLRLAGVAPVQNAQTIASSTGLTLAEAQSFIDNFYGAADPFVIDPGAPNPEPLTLSAARGGEITGPGTGTSDSIPARLSDGEFVMTADAVRGAGNGDRNLGAARMYDMMSRYERGVA